MNKPLVILIIILVIGIGVFILFSGSSQTTQNTNSPTNENVKTFVLTGENYKFVMGGVDNPEIHVKQGDTVRIELTSTQGFHDWNLDEFDASTDKVNQGQSTSVEFVATQKGKFEYYCSVGQHRANGMWGYFVVE